MNTPMDTWRKIQGLKQPKTRKPVLYWEARYMGIVVDVNNSIPILRSKWRGEWNGHKVTFHAIR